jgi:hypothetical protein
MTVAAHGQEYLDRYCQLANDERTKRVAAGAKLVADALAAL